MIQITDSTTYNLIRSALDTSAARGKVISNNLANVNTPEFKRSDVNFEENLRQILKSDTINLNTTNERHINDNNVLNSGYTVEKDTSTSMRADGNNVDVDKEMVSLASNNMYYNFLTSRISGKISTQRYIITDGRK